MFPRYYNWQKGRIWSLRWATRKLIWRCLFALISNNFYLPSTKRRSCSSTKSLWWCLYWYPIIQRITLSLLDFSGVLQDSVLSSFLYSHCSNSFPRILRSPPNDDNSPPLQLHFISSYQYLICFVKKHTGLLTLLQIIFAELLLNRWMRKDQINQVMLYVNVMAVKMPIYSYF